MERWALNLLEWIIKSPRRTMIFVILYKPMLYCDIKTALRLSKNDRVDELKELIEKKLFVCKTPLLRKGRLYGLTIYGRRIRKALIEFLDDRTKEKLMERLNIKEIRQEYRELREIRNWEVYAEIDVSKKQLKPLLEILDTERKGVKQIGLELKEKTGNILSSGTLNCFLKKLRIMKVANAEREGRNVYYSITEHGIVMKKQLNA